ncbi:MAG: TonB-dependent receptor [Bacteroidales bacterium]
MMKNLVICFTLLLILNNVASQTKDKIFGYVFDASNGESLIGANVWLKHSHTGTSTNAQGYFSLNAKKLPDTLIVSCLGYKPYSLPITNVIDSVLMLNLSVDTIAEVIIKRPVPEYMQKSQTGLELLISQDVKTLPVILGESDITRTLQTLPGVASGTENTAGFFVRGGSHDQNQILIDGVPLYHAYHLYGLFSVFNTDAINTAQFYRGSVPAQYNSRLSSVLDIRMKEGNQQHVSGQINLGPLTSKILLEGPLIKNKTSFLITTRRSIFDLLPPNLTYNITWVSGIDQTKRNIKEIRRYYFVDYSGKINHQFNNRNSISISYYFANDNYSGQSWLFNNQSLNWGSSLYSMRWKSILSTGTFFTATLYETSFAYSNTIYQDNNPNNQSYTKMSSKVIERSAILAFESLVNQHKIKYGGQLSWYRLQPETRNRTYIVGAPLPVDTIIGMKMLMYQQNLFIEDVFNLTRRLTLNVGANINHHVADSQNIITLHPRLSMGYEIINGIILKGSYTSLQQALHLLQSSSLGSPADLWVSSLHNIRPAKAQQYVVGLSYRPNRSWEISVEAYHKSMQNILGYQYEQYIYMNPSRWESVTESGTGTSRGIELMLSKRSGKLSGWCSYTLSQSYQKFPNINYGQTFPFSFDRRHVLNIVTIAHLSKKINLGTTWIYMSGHPVSISVQNIANETTGNQEEIFYLPSLNNYRLPIYHRLDVNLNYQTTFKKVGMECNVGAYNVYNRSNPYSIKRNVEGIFVTYLLPILPYFNFTFKF